MAALRPFIIVLLALSLAACKTDLLTGLSQRQANEALALLQRHQIDVAKKIDGKKDFKLVVENLQFPDAVRLLTEHQLPSRDDVSISDMFPADSLVTTPMSERARLLSGIEQRLEKTLSGIQNVATARVHASYPVVEGDRRRVQPMRLSVVVTYEGNIPEEVFSEKIKRVARNSFNGLAYDDISVVLFARRAEDGLSATPDAHPMLTRPAVWFVTGLLSLVLLAAGFQWQRRRRQRALHVAGHNPTQHAAHSATLPEASN
jgi:type III secretion protein J